MHRKNTFQIKHHRLYHQGQPIPFLASPNQSAPFTPQGVILHDTAGRLHKGNSVHWFRQDRAKASAHLVLERDGSLTQMVAFDKKAWHAGKSAYQGRHNVNDFAIGIEIVNPGRCEKLSDGRFKPWFEEHFSPKDAELDFAYATSKNHGEGWWLHYTKAQIKALCHLCACLRDVYDLRFLAGHYEISPGRKIDPNPLFPLEELRQSLFPNCPEKQVRQEKAPFRKKVWAHQASPLRKWPSFNDNIILTVPEGAIVRILRQGEFDNGQGKELWYLGDYASQQGWIKASGLEKMP